MKSDPEVARVAQAIVQYLARHPHAYDTVEGIRQFWFSEIPKPGEETVMEALELLIAQGFVVESRSPAATTFYGGNPDRLRPGSRT